MRRIFYDAEFIEDGRTIDLTSIGMVDDQGREYYAVNSEMPTDRIREHTWLMFNVVPHLPVTDGTLRGIEARIKHGENLFPRPGMDCDLDLNSTLVRPKWVIRNEILKFLAPDEEELELWAYYGAYDHVTLAQFWGPMIHLPRGVPMWTHELMQLWEQAGRPSKPLASMSEHRAIDDARWSRDLFLQCQKALEKA